jgi:tetraacyldisaccharide 4'-kinase
VGGTGKSPMVEYLVRILKNKYKVATVSRGYKRKTKGYALANENSTALDIGDEPMQFHLKFPDIAVAVGEERLVAIPQLLHDKPGTEVIILDDAFQHRRVRAGLNILLTEHNNLFTRDFYMPTGDLRDLKSQYKRAHVIVITKCAPAITTAHKEKIIKEIRPKTNQSVFLTAIRYDQPYHIIKRSGVLITDEMKVLLVTGIANPSSLKTWVEQNCKEYNLAQYADHHIFTIDDLTEIKRKYDAIEGSQKIILTTEKDAVRLLKFGTEIKDLPIYVLPVRHDFLFDEQQVFDELVMNFIRDFKHNDKN